MTSRRGEEGTTLVELLVVTLLLGIIGTVTTAGLVMSFQTQLTATRGAETLDEVRLSVQRMRDVVRGADEVCASSTPTRLAVWTDREGVGTLGVDEDVEVTIFEVDPATSKLTRSVRNSGTTTLISDVIVTPGGDVFSYDVAPSAQEADLVCLDGATVSGGSVDTARVDLDLDVQNADGVDTVETTTSMRVRNAGLSDVTGGGGAGSFNDPPTAAVNLPAQCIEGQPCALDGVGSDPESGPLTYEWDLDGDSAFDDAAVEDPTPTFSTAGTVLVALRVTDDQGQTATATGTIEIVAAGANLSPVAAFTYQCSGANCQFDADDSSYPHSSEPDATESSDAEDAQSALTYEWFFGTGSTVPDAEGPDQSESFGVDSIDVTLRVTDVDGASSESHQTISTHAETIRVESLTATGSNAGGGDGQFTATLTIRITTTTGFNRSNVLVSVDVDNAVVSSDSCTTASDGTCNVAVTAPRDNTVAFTIDSVSDEGGTAPYDAGQNKAESVSVTKNQTNTAP